MRKAQRHIDFAAFIQNHEEEIFGKKRKLTGQSYALAYRKQIAALDMKMNEFINKDDPRARDLTFMLGLFAFSISQFAVQIKTDVNRYAAAFYALFEEGEEQ